MMLCPALVCAKMMVQAPYARRAGCHFQMHPWSLRNQLVEDDRRLDCSAGNITRPVIVEEFTDNPHFTKQKQKMSICSYDREEPAVSYN